MKVSKTTQPNDLIDRDALVHELKNLTSVQLSCSYDEFVEAIKPLSTLCADDISGGTICITDVRGSVAVAPKADVGVISPIESNVLFVCPYCGTHFLARDPGFIPNCHNCNGVMRMAKTSV